MLVHDIYYYVLNAQGDVVGLLNAAGELVVEYEYDPWGKLLNTKIGVDEAHSKYEEYNNMGLRNPLRYRGYIYDRDTGLYYLQSRYYDPAIGRFINADTYTTTDASGVLSTNMFAYCENNPVNGSDPTGEWFIQAALIGAAVDAAAYLVGCAISGEEATWEGVGKAALKGAVTGVAFGAAGKVASKVVGKVASKAANVIKKTSKSKGVCFVAGTMVLSENGQIPIEDIKAGDMVWATDPETGKTELKEVVQTFEKESTELIHISVAGNEIVCTNEHPFYSPVKGWTAACKLRAGDVLVTVNGELVVVEWVQHELLENPIKVYNFEVEGFHTYYVGDDGGVLVHNKCYTDSFSTGRVTPSNLTEKIAMESVRSNPNAGKIIMNKLNDPRLPKGSVKMAQSFDTYHGRVEIHYIWDKIGKHFFDFKYK